MKSDDLDMLKFRLDYLAEWLRRNREAQAIISLVQTDFEITQWELEALTEQPDEAREVASPNVSASARTANEYLPSALPMMPVYDRSKVLRATAVSTSGSADIYTYVSRIGDIPTLAAQQYSLKYTEKYQQLQQIYGRVDEIRALLRNLKNPQTGDRFEKALQSYAASKSGAINRTAAANEMINLLSGVKGDLLKSAQRWPKENMTWEEMTVRLAKGDINTPEHDQLQRQKLVFSSLVDRLSDVKKDREGGSLTNLDDIWTQVLDHLYIVLSLVTIQ